MGRTTAELVVTDEEREVLVRWSRRAKSSQALAQRCRIVLGCAEGKTNQQVAADLGTWPQTVGKWRRRFIYEEKAIDQAQGSSLMIPPVSAQCWTPSTGWPVIPARPSSSRTGRQHLRRLRVGRYRVMLEINQR